MLFQPSQVVGKEIDVGINSSVFYLRPPRCGGSNRLEQKQQSLPVCPLIQQSQGSFCLTQDFQNGETERSSTLLHTSQIPRINSVPMRL